MSIHSVMMAGLMALMVLQAPEAQTRFGAYGQDAGASDMLGGVVPPATPAATPATPAPATVAPAEPADSLADAAVTNAESQKRCVPACYDTPNAKAGCDVSGQCHAFDKANPGYFENIDRTCQLPAGTAIKMAQLESTCTTQARNQFGYTGMFQFDTRSCTKGSLYDLRVQAACMCEYTANTRRQFAAANNGQLPSAGMYYLFHQQGGGCAMKLAFGGNQRAVDVVQRCGNVSASKAYRRIACNIPGGGCNNPRAATITAQEFANIYLSKFNGIDNTNICSGGNPDALAGSGAGTAAVTAAINQAMAANPYLAAFVNAAGGPTAMANMINGSGNLTSTGLPMLAANVLKVLGMEDTSEVYSPISNSDYPDDDTGTSTEVRDDGATTLTVTHNPDGSKTVQVVTPRATTTHQVALGSKLWGCDGTYHLERSDPTNDAARIDEGCDVVAEGTAEDAR